MLHGDLTPGNILDGGARRGLVAIDPAPCLADAAFDAVDLILWQADGLGTIEARPRPLGRRGTQVFYLVLDEEARLSATHCAHCRGMTCSRPFCRTLISPLTDLVNWSGPACRAAPVFAPPRQL